MHDIADYKSDEKMLLPDVTLLALNLMNQHGLIEAGWHFEFDRSKLRLGCCKHSKKIISLSRILTPGQTKASIVNTLLHEIAHCLVGPGKGHNAVWKAKAKEIGCTGDRCSAATGDKVEYRWYAVCDHCDLRVGMHRAPNRVRSCHKCSPWGFDTNRLLSWEQNGKTAEVTDMPFRFQQEWQSIQERYLMQYHRPA